MPARPPEAAVVWWWRWLGDHGVPGAGDQWRAVWYEPVIGGMACEDIKTRHLQAVVNAAPTAQEGKRLHALVSALVGAGIIWGPGQRAAEAGALAGERAAAAAGAADQG